LCELPNEFQHSRLDIDDRDLQISSTDQQGVIFVVTTDIDYSTCKHPQDLSEE